MLNCHSATLLLSKELDEKLPFTRRCALKMHLLICSGCRNFRHQLYELRTIAHTFVRLDGGGPDTK
ncbi:zf-HC2 domain-containing protein [Citrobacter meridianamericanus]|uniref:zf-HC2 domain-containing protein n=1 Tax=Citrobacter meridianamericanus TaxID=2894201 RepID=UPI0039BE810D